MSQPKINTTTVTQFTTEALKDAYKMTANKKVRKLIMREVVRRKSLGVGNRPVTLEDFLG